MERERHVDQQMEIWRDTGMEREGERDRHR